MYVIFSLMGNKYYKNSTTRLHIDCQWQLKPPPHRTFGGRPKATPAFLVMRRLRS